MNCTIEFRLMAWRLSPAPVQPPGVCHGLTSLIWVTPTVAIDTTVLLGNKELT